MTINNYIYSKSKKVVFSLMAFALFSLFFLFGSNHQAKAADESASVFLSMNPQQGVLFKEAYRPVNWELGVDISAPDTSPMINPLKRTVIQFPRVMRFVPGSTPVCTDQQFNQMSNLALGPEEIAKLCPRSVIGNGTGAIYIAGVNHPAALISDPKLLIFYGGIRNGNPSIKIYGYSQTTNVGVYMVGILNNNRQMAINVPVLSNDSALGVLRMKIPGTDDSNPAFRGRSRNFVQTICHADSWPFKMDLTLGTRAYPSGTPIGPDSFVTATSTTNCKGWPGRANLVRPQVAGPQAVRVNRRGQFRVAIRNGGTATARNVRVVVAGRVIRLNRRVGQLRPGERRVLRFNVRPRGRVGTRARAVFRVLGSNSPNRATTRFIRIRR